MDQMPQDWDSVIWGSGISQQNAAIYLWKSHYS